MNQEKLALAGFYHHNNNNVICYFCKHQIKDNEWNDASDDIIAKHLAKSPSCPFLKGVNKINIPRNAEHNEQNNGNSIEYAYSLFKNYDKRMESFSDWPIGLPQKKDDMACAGFFYTGKSDKVICFSCGLNINKWKPTDLPIILHAKYLGKCEFMEIVKGIEFINSIKQNI